MNLTIEQALIKSVAAHKEGNLQEAERLYRAVLKSQPLNPDANHNLGVIAVSVNQVAAAIPFFKNALAANPKIEQFWLSYIDALIRQTNLVLAKQVIKEAKQHGISKIKLKGFKAQLIAANDAAYVSQLSPPKQQLKILFEHFQNKRFSDAEKLATSLTKQFPEHQYGWKILGVVLKKSDRFKEALAPCEKSVELSSKDAEAHSNLGNVLKELGRLEEAESSYRKSIALQPDYAGAHSNLGALLREKDRLEESEASYLKSIALRPESSNTHFYLAVTQQDQGKLDAAKASYRHAITLQPQNAGAHRNLSMLKKFKSQDEQYCQMQELYLDDNTSAEDRCDINFGLAKVYEDLENFEQAFTHYHEGNKLRKQLLKFNMKQETERFRRIKSFYPQIVQHSVEHGQYNKNLMPIFIVGMPRSGTTITEQIISSHPQVTGGGELDFVAEFGATLARGGSQANDNSLLIFREKYLSKLQEIANGKTIVTDKMPLNFRYLGLLAAAFPEAKIVHLQRDPAAVCWANYKNYFSSKVLGYSFGLDDVVTYYSLYQKLMKFWENELGNKIYHLDYELLTTNQESETRKLIDYLELDWDEKLLSPQDNSRHVKTASNIQIRQKVYQGSSLQWKKYEPFINGAFDGLLGQ